MKFTNGEYIIELNKCKIYICSKFPHNFNGFLPLSSANEFCEIHHISCRVCNSGHDKKPKLHGAVIYVNYTCLQNTPKIASLHMNVFCETELNILHGDPNSVTFGHEKTQVRPRQNIRLRYSATLRYTPYRARTVLYLNSGT